MKGVVVVQHWRRSDAGQSWSAPWTEYSVYFLFAHHAGLHAAYHVDIRDANDQTLQVHMPIIQKVMHHPSAAPMLQCHYVIPANMSKYLINMTTVWVC